MPGESKTNFEKFWLQGMEHTEVLQHLHFHKSFAPPAVDQQPLVRFQGQMQNLQEQVHGLKRKLDQGKGQRDWQGSPSGGKGRKGAKGSGVEKAQEEKGACLVFHKTLQTARRCA